MIPSINKQKNLIDLLDKNAVRLYVTGCRWRPRQCGSPAGKPPVLKKFDLMTLASSPAGNGVGVAA